MKTRKIHRMQMTIAVQLLPINTVKVTKIKQKNNHEDAGASVAVDASSVNSNSSQS